MKGQCEKCGQSYGFETENIRGFSVTFRCKTCDHIIKVSDDESDRRPMVPLESLEYKNEGKAFSSKPGKQPFVALESLEYKIKRSPVSHEESKKKQSTQWIIAAIITVLAILVITMITNIKKRDRLRLEMEKRLNVAIAEKIKKYNAFFESIQEEVIQSADYLKKLYENQNPPGDNGKPLLLPWDGKQFGNDEIRNKLKNEILIQKAFSAFLKETVRNKPYIDLAYSGTQSNISTFSNEEVIPFIEKNAPGFFPSKRPWYTKAEIARKLIWTDVYVDASQRQLDVSCAMPVLLNDNRIPAVVGFDVKLSELQKDILVMDPGYNSRVFLMNAEGKILLRSQGGIKDDELDQIDNLFKTRSASLKDIAMKMAKGETGLATYNDNKNKEKYLAYGYFPAIRVSLGIMVSKSEIK